MVVQIRHDVDVEALRDRTFWFNRTNPNWSNNSEHNMFFLAATQNMWNDMLIARGYVFLNDILTAIGLPETVEGNLVGWMLNFRGPAHIEMHMEHDGDPDNGIYIRFNIQDVILFEMPSAHAISVARHTIVTSDN